MGELAIQARGIGKQYRVGSQAAVFVTLRDVIAEKTKRGARRMAGVGRAGRDPVAEEPPTFIWSLRDISFDIERGETVGLVGLNGAGKTTLLKVLSRVTEPTAGRAEIHGRVGSLLEAAAGFHPELTGRENVFLNGAILGMRRASIERQFDDIVGFAGVEQFLDTPVKRYSTGMYVRLAFAVAAHLDTEVLFVDEVLAVGDQEFQRRCLAKIQEVARGDRAVLFVSHSMAAVRRVCTRGLLLEGGRLVADGPIDEVVDKYLSRSAEGVAGADEIPTESFVASDVRIASLAGETVRTFEPVEIEATLTAKRTVREPTLFVGVLSVDNQRIAGVDFKDHAEPTPMQAGDRRVFRLQVDALPLLPGAYRLELHAKDLTSGSIETVPRLFPFSVVETAAATERSLDQWYGHVGLRARAEVRTISESHGDER
jgi:lipopolysaccharide transport system ATP-binding protein